MAIRRICDFLAGSGMPYSIARHPRAYTAQEVAEASHVPGTYMAKTVIVWIDDQLAMAVVPATRALDLDSLRSQSGASKVRLADESEFVNVFTDCQLGTAPPFGNLFGLRTLVDLKLALQELIAFNAGTHTEVIRMKYSDYSTLVKPLVLHISAGPVAVAPRMRPKPKPNYTSAERRHEAEETFGQQQASPLQVQAECPYIPQQHSGSD
ncbi:MAG: YbaK/EbsC family protein [Tepidisphaeraceae bacterium]|jgi:Ala-tRNA(Pro) deacylase